MLLYVALSRASVLKGFLHKHNGAVEVSGKPAVCPARGEAGKERPPVWRQPAWNFMGDFGDGL